MANQWFDQALAGPGTLARTEEKVFDFNCVDTSLRGWRVMTDKGIGGSSEGTMSILEDKYLRFSGHLCPPFELPSSRSPKPETRKEEDGGDSASNQKQTPPEKRISNAFSVLQTEQGLLQSYDLEPYRSLLLKVRGDGRKYVVSLRTENWIIPGTVSDDVFQGYIQPTRGEWEEILLPFDKFLLTWQGKVLNDPVTMNHRNLFSMSFASVGLLPEETEEEGVKTADANDKKQGEQEGPFCLDIQWVKATTEV